MKLLTVTEAAERLRLSKSTIYKWISCQGRTQGTRVPRLRTVKLGSRVLITEDELERFIRESQR